MARTILHIDLDAFFVSVEQVLNPSLRGKPVIVGGLSGRGVVASASYEARKFHIRAGMPVITARLLCPQAIFLEGNFSLYRDYSGGFMDILSGFTPLLEPGGLDEAYLDLTGFHLLYGPPAETAKNIRAAIRKELGLAASVGISTCKVVSKIASDMAKPDGMLEVYPGKEREFLAPLVVEKMPGIGPKTGKRLKDLGLHTLGQVAALPSHLLKDVFGKGGESMQLFALGKDDRPVSASHRGGSPGENDEPWEAKSISREVTFPCDTLNLSYLKGVLASLTQEVGRELRSVSIPGEGKCRGTASRARNAIYEGLAVQTGKGRKARTITLKVRHDDFETFTHSTTLKAAIDTNQEIYQAAWQLMETAIGKRLKPFRLLGISASNLVCGEEQLSFFSAHQVRQRRIDMVVDRIQLKYGPDSLQWGRAFLYSGFS